MESDTKTAILNWLNSNEGSGQLRIPCRGFLPCMIAGCVVDEDIAPSFNTNWQYVTFTRGTKLMEDGRRFRCAISDSFPPHEMSGEEVS